MTQLAQVTQVAQLAQVTQVTQLAQMTQLARVTQLIQKIQTAQLTQITQQWTKAGILLHFIIKAFIIYQIIQLSRYYSIDQCHASFVNRHTRTYFG